MGVRRGGIGAERAAHLEPAPSGHHQVEEHEIGTLGGDRRHGLVAVGRGVQVHGLVEQVLERLLDEQPDVLLVIHDQDRARH